MEQMSLDLPELKSHIGIRLREAREAQTLSPACIGRELKIQPNYIEAIETLDRDALPSIGYVLGYVRAYAKFVGLDAKAAVKDFKSDSEVPENLGMRDRPHFVPKKQIRLPRGFFAAVTVMACTGVLAFWYSSNTDAHSSALSAMSEIGKSSDQVVKPATIAADRMSIQAIAPTWVELKDKDGKVIISRILTTGESWEAHQDDNITLSARDSGALELYIGKDLMGRLGVKGMPMTDIPMPAVPPDFMSDYARELAGLLPRERIDLEAEMTPSNEVSTAHETKNGL